MNRASRAIAQSIYLAGLLLLVLTACGERAPDSGCTPVGGNLLEDIAFTTLEAPRPERKWQSAEHSGGGSFSYGASDGVLWIEQNGLEPWMVVTQSPDAGPLAGKVVEFSADIKLDLVPPERAHDFKLGGGLALLARRDGQLLLNSMLDHEPHMGRHGWQAVRVVVALPMMMNYLQVGFLHQAGGSLQVKNPVLRLVSQTCPLTPLGE